jgi:hypothetical protein
MNVSSTHFHHCYRRQLPPSNLQPNGLILGPNESHRDSVNGGNDPIVGPCQIVFEAVRGDGQCGSGKSP